MIRKYSKKVLEKCKEECKDFLEFFQKYIEIVKNKCCEECGDKLKGYVSEIVYILNKFYYKLIFIDDDNVIYFCGVFLKNGCYNKFDLVDNKKFKEMFVYLKIKIIFVELESKIIEKINYKIYDRYID